MENNAKRYECDFGFEYSKSSFTIKDIQEDRTIILDHTWHEYEVQLIVNALNEGIKEDS